MAESDEAEPTAARGERDAVASFVGWALLIGGVMAAIMWLPVALLPGGFILIDAPAAGEALRAGIWSGTVGSVSVR